MVSEAGYKSVSETGYKSMTEVGYESVSEAGCKPVKRAMRIALAKKANVDDGCVRLTPSRVDFVPSPRRDCIQRSATSSNFFREGFAGRA
jgi:hypothetical protein